MVSNDYFHVCFTKESTRFLLLQEAQLSPSDRAMRLVSSNLANYHANSTETTYTPSPDQTDGMKLEV